MTNKPHNTFPQLNLTIPGRLIVAAATTVFFIIFLKNAWVCDDAYIIFRSIEQLFAGNGPIWNPHERVQVFTSPLWYWLNAVPRLFSSDVFLNVTLLSITLCALMLYQLFKIAEGSFQFLILCLILFCSNGFFDYTSSGLENPLAYLLIASYLRFYLQLDQQTKIDIQSFRNLLITYGLLLVTRHDLSLLLLPATLLSIWNTRHQLSSNRWMLYALLALMPLIGWSLFSLIYYGSIFPNTAYAKLNTGMSRLELITQGLYYYLATLEFDLFTLLTIAAGLVIAIASKRPTYQALAAGIILNLIYVIYVGGDFMQGRFFSYSFLIATIILVTTLSKNSSKRLLITSGLLLGYALFYPHTPFNSPLNHSNHEKLHGVADERGFYFQTSSLYQYFNYHNNKANRPPYFPVHPWSDTGWQLSQQTPAIYFASGIGMIGYWCGNKQIIIDVVALSDPLLARIPADDHERSIVGHYVRTVPEGYIKSLQTRENHFEDKKLGEFYEKVKIITQSKNLFTWERLKTILIMNLGGYNHLIEHLKQR